MTQAPFEFDIVIPLYRVRWNTQAVMEGLTLHYSPRSIHIVTPQPVARSLQTLTPQWATAPIVIHEEETFFQQRTGLSKDDICAALDLGESLYTPGWFYQQLLKLGAPEGIESLSEWYVVWDSDLLPGEPWPLFAPDQTPGSTPKPAFALLQHNQWGNPQIVSKWQTWIESILKVEAVTDVEGTFVPHHMWFRQDHLASFQAQIGEYFQSDRHWLLLMMESANTFGTFSEYWAYVSWVAAKAPNDLTFYAYHQYGATTERFFDDGTGLFSAALRQFLGAEAESAETFSPSYSDVRTFITAQYPPDPLPSSLSFESSPRHLKKDEKNMHIEESRSRWNPRNLEPAATP